MVLTGCTSFGPQSVADEGFPEMLRGSFKVLGFLVSPGSPVVIGAILLDNAQHHQEEHYE
jgi:hypothetical protein